MWNSRKLLLSAVMFTAVCYRVPVQSATLDMASDAVDDQYNGCRKKAMEKFIESGLLKEELDKNVGFQKAWNSSTNCLKKIPGVMKEHTTALSAYGDGDSNFIKSFNNGVNTMGINVSSYENDFHFKSLHFLLMDSLKLLGTKNCKAVYVVTEKQYTAQKGSTVRFGKFITGHLTYKSAKGSGDFHGMVVFNISSCFFVNLEDNACTKDMALLSPAEVFTVEDVKAKEEDDAEYTEIILKHSDVKSYHNCYIFSRSPDDISSKWLVSLFVPMSLFVFNY